MSLPLRLVAMSAAISPPETHVILVVEDEMLLRFLTIEALEDAGFHTLEAMHAAEALSHLRRDAAGIHALFTDVHMPGEMNGVMLAHEARRCWPWIHQLITSGHLMPQPHELPAASRFLPKPYTLTAVIAHLQEMIAA